jgi:outer membrane PBP1 activator LpoA protein
MLGSLTLKRAAQSVGRPLTVLVLTAGLAACGGTELDFGTETPPVAGPAADPMVIGTGETTIALLLPLSAGGSASGLAEIFRNAAELALADADRQAVRVLVKDTQGSEDGGRFAAETAVAEGARMIIGPIFALVTSKEQSRVEELLAMYYPRFSEDFLAHVPMKES